MIPVRSPNSAPHISPSEPVRGARRTEWPAVPRKDQRHILLCLSWEPKAVCRCQPEGSAKRGPEFWNLTNSIFFFLKAKLNTYTGSSCPVESKAFRIQSCTDKALFRKDKLGLSRCVSWPYTSSKPDAGVKFFSVRCTMGITHCPSPAPSITE